MEFTPLGPDANRHDLGAAACVTDSESAVVSAPLSGSD